MPAISLPTPLDPTTENVWGGPLNTAINQINDAVDAVTDTVDDLGDSATRDVGSTAGTVAAGDDSRITGAVQSTRQVSAGTGLTGGGDLSANRTLAADFGTASGKVAQGNDSRITGAAQYRGTWSSATTYGTGELVVGSDGQLYASLAGSNLNHDPTTDGGVHWTDYPSASAGEQLVYRVDYVEPYVADATSPPSGGMGTFDSFSNGDSMLLTRQATGADNGPWIAQNSGAWSRPSWWTTGDTKSASTLFIVGHQSSFNESFWVTASEVVVGTGNPAPWPNWNNNTLAFARLDDAGAGVVFWPQFYSGFLWHQTPFPVGTEPQDNGTDPWAYLDENRSLRAAHRDTNPGNFKLGRTALWGGVWNSAETYNEGTVVVGSDDNPYASLADSNLNHDPTTDGAVHWTATPGGGGGGGKPRLSVIQYSIDPFDPATFDYGQALDAATIIAGPDFTGDSSVDDLGVTISGGNIYVPASPTIASRIKVTATGSIYLYTDISGSTLDYSFDNAYLMYVGFNTPLTNGVPQQLPVMDAQVVFGAHFEEIVPGGFLFPGDLASFALQPAFSLQKAGSWPTATLYYSGAMGFSNNSYIFIWA